MCIGFFGRGAERKQKTMPPLLSIAQRPPLVAFTPALLSFSTCSSHFHSSSPSAPNISSHWCSFLSLSWGRSLKRARPPVSLTVRYWRHWIRPITEIWSSDRRCYAAFVMALKRHFELWMFVFSGCPHGFSDVKRPSLTYEQWLAGTGNGKRLRPLFLVQYRQLFVY